MNRRHSLPAEVYALVEHSPATVLLECGKDHNIQTGPQAADSCSRLFTAPARVCVANTPAEIPSLFRSIEAAVQAGQFAAGFFTYECGNSFEPKAGLPPSQPGQPLAWFGIYDRPYRFDHATGKFLDGEPPELARFPVSGDAPASDSPIAATLALTEQQYAEKIAAIHQWIRAGDVYQLNFTVPYSLRVDGGIAALYLKLRARQPVDYGAFLHWQPGRRILSFSPELFFRLEEINGSRRITAKPMKGTAARGRITREDRDRAEWLRNDPKNRSENLMIVDLLRNDLGRLANFGTVKAENLFAVERHPTLWQMTSTVTADLRPDVGFHDIFRALFPCGSITGAPKVRAMQLLAGLEARPRGVYTGAIGFFSPRRTVFNVAIRTLDLDGNSGVMGVGGGIVIDSNAAGEFRECLLKAEFLTGPPQASSGNFAPPEEFHLIETMLWHRRYPLLPLHLDRLIDSADYFAFPCDRTTVEAALEHHAHRFTDPSPRKVRLLAAVDGTLQITSELLPSASDPDRIGRVFLSSDRTDPADKWLYHKTTQRPLYAHAFKQAQQANYDDVLFFNQRNQVTEGAISNIFIRKKGQLLTPPIECGLLAGVHRRHLLETQPNIVEQVLTAADLRHADAVYLSNAVRGLWRVAID